MLTVFYHKRLAAVNTAVVDCPELKIKALCLVDTSFFLKEARSTEICQILFHSLSDAVGYGSFIGKIIQDITLTCPAAGNDHMSFLVPYTPSVFRAAEKLFQIGICHKRKGIRTDNGQFSVYFIIHSITFPARRYSLSFDIITLFLMIPPSWSFPQLRRQE